MSRLSAEPVTTPDGVVDLEYLRAKRFFNKLKSHAFVAILVDEDETPAVVRMYTKGVSLDEETLRKIRELIDELEEELDGQ